MRPSRERCGPPLTPAPPGHHLPHSGAGLSPVLREATATAEGDPLQQCLAVNAWSMAVVGVALPLVVLHRLQRGARQAFEAQRRRGRRGRAGAPALQRGPEALSCTHLRWLCVASLLAWAAASTLALRPAAA